MNEQLNATAKLYLKLPARLSAWSTTRALVIVTSHYIAVMIVFPTELMPQEFQRALLPQTCPDYGFS